MTFNRDSKKQSLILTLAVYTLALSAAVFTYTLLPAELSMLYKTLIADIVATVVVFLFSRMFNNSSFYDPYWSIIPPVIFSFWFFSTYTGESLSLRGVMILLISGFWGIRLTLNWAIGWPGLIHEDWRYVSFREKFGKFYWLISFMGIHFFPTLIVFLCAIPAYLALTTETGSLNYIDLIAVVAGIIAIFFEWRSDYELFRHRRSSDSGTPIRTGLWKYSRHPNYFGEILFWCSLYFFALASSLSNYWIGIAPLGMLSLFLFYSIPAMEKRQCQRRKEYREIQKSISMLFPRPPKDYERFTAK